MGVVSVPDTSLLLLPLQGEYFSYFFSALEYGVFPWETVLCELLQHDAFPWAAILHSLLQHGSFPWCRILQEQAAPARVTCRSQALPANLIQSGLLSPQG